MKKQIVKIIILMSFALLAKGQGINYPGNVPSNNGGAGNARTDADNFFTRNNAAAMTEISDDTETADKTAKWRLMVEMQGTFYRFERKFVPFGFSQIVQSEASIIVPGLSGEITYTAKSRKYAFGVGLSQTFGFEAKLKDSPEVLGSRAQYFDTRVASNDLALAGAARLHKKISIGGSFIFGRGFLVQIAPAAQLAVLGIIKQNRLDVSGIGAPGASFNVHFRPSEKISLGFNFKTARKYDLQGKLDTVQPILSPTGLQILPLTLSVKVPFKLPAILEAGIKIQPTKRFFIDFDYRFYLYSQALDKVRVLDKQSGGEIFTQNTNAKNVHLFLVGGAYKLTETSKILYGADFTTNGFPDDSFNPGLYNANAISFSGGFAKRLSGTWFNLGATAITGLKRTINAAPQNAFPGTYKSGGIIIGFGIRR